MSNDSMSNTVTQATEKVNTKKDKSVVAFYNYLSWFFKNSEEATPRMIVVPNYLMRLTQHAGKAMFLAQLIYLDTLKTRQDGYFWKSKTDLKRELCMDDSTLSRYEREFKHNGWIDTKVIKAWGKPTVHYKLNFKQLANDIYDVCEAEGLVVSKDYAIKEMKSNNKQ